MQHMEITAHRKCSVGNAAHRKYSTWKMQYQYTFRGPGEAPGCPRWGWPPWLWVLAQGTAAAPEQQCHSPAPFPVSLTLKSSKSSYRAVDKGVHPLHFLKHFILSAEIEPFPAGKEITACFTWEFTKRCVVLIRFSGSICGLFLTQLHSRLIFVFKTLSHNP